MKKGFVTIIIILFVAVGQAQQRHELTVTEAVELAYKNVVELKNVQLDYEIQKGKNNELLSQAYPQVTSTFSANHYLKLPAILFPDATSAAVYQILKNEGVSGSAGPIINVPAPTQRQVSFQQPWNLSLGASVSQLLFQPDVFVGLQARETALNLSKATIEQTKEKIKDSAYKRYYAILITQKQSYYLNEGMKRLQKLYHDDSIMYVNGFAERLDLDKVQVQINNLTSTISQVDQALQIGYATLKYSIGIPQKDLVVLKDDLNTENLRADILLDDFNYEDRPEVRTLAYAKKLQELDVKRHKLGYIPTVSAVGNYSVNGMGPKFFTSSQTVWINSAFVGLNINIPIFDGFQRRSKIQQSELNLQKVENTISNVKQAIDLEQEITRGTLLTALKNLDIQEKNMQLAEKVFNTTKLKFQNGLGNSFEVLQADGDVQQAQGNYFNALYNAIIAKISFQYSKGKLQ